MNELHFNKEDFIPAPAEKEKTLEVIRQAVDEKKVRYQPSFFQAAWAQLSYLSLSSLIGQLFMMVLLVLSFVYLDGAGQGRGSYLAFSSAGISFLGVFLVIELSRSFSYRMAEVEQSCYFQLKQVWCLKMLFYGILDLMMLLLLTFLLFNRFHDSILRFGIYLLVPFTISNFLYFVVFTYVRGFKNNYAMLFLAFLAGIAGATPSCFPEAYEKGNLFVWALIFFLSAVMLAAFLYHLLKEVSKGEELCMN